MSTTVRQLAEWVHGTVSGDGELPIRDARALGDAEIGTITFVEDERHLHAWEASRASAAVTSTAFPANGRPLIRVADPLMAFARIVGLFRAPAATDTAWQIDPTARIHPTATLGEGAVVGAYAVVGAGAVLGARVHLHAGVCVGQNCTLGDDVTLFPHVVLYDDCRIGHRVIVHANSVLGADGFGYRLQAGRHVKVPQLGTVDVADDVEIGACTTIDRGTFGPTRVGLGTKIDNLVMVAHNCQIGKHNLLVGQVGIAGSTTTGDYVVMAGQVGVADHIHIGDRAQLGAKAGVHKDVPADSRMLGSPATSNREQLRIMRTLEKLPEMRKDVMRMLHHLGLEESP